jgi:hypothetical protein
MTLEFMEKQIFAAFNGSDEAVRLPALCGALLEMQKNLWRQLRDNHAFLAQSDYRDLMRNGFSFRIQFNPGRILSAKAKIDPQSIAGRKCFLCLENLPEAQQGILYRGEYLVLCNPWPIFPRHFTISHLEHRPQAIESCFSAMLQSAKDLSPEYAIFYNGPRCGASAPDHLHLQAAPAGSMPIEEDIARREKKRRLCNIGTVGLYKAATPERSILIMEGKTIEDFRKPFDAFLKAMRQSADDLAEPMINIICSCRNDLWTVMIFPRQKFRPAVYFLEGEEQLLISPGAVEMGGFVVTPRKKDFDKLNMGIIDALLREVSLDADAFDNALNKMMEDESA